MRYIDSYYKMVMLSNEQKINNKIRAKQRFDCIKYTNEYLGIKPFMNKKGMFFLNLTEQRQFVTANSKRQTEFSLTGQGLNFTGLYFEHIQNTSFCYGYPLEKPKLKNGKLNPVFEFRKDLYLFIINPFYTEIEILIVKNCKGFASDYLQSLINNEFDDEIDVLRSEAKQFYNYDVNDLFNQLPIAV